MGARKIINVFPLRRNKMALVKYNPLRDNDKKYIYIYIYIYIRMNKLLNLFALHGNEIKYVEKKRKILQFFAPCGNKRMTDSSVSLFHIFLLFWIFWSNMNHYVEVKWIGDVETKI